MHIYQTIKTLPIDLEFSNKTKAELKLYGTWFAENKVERLQMLINTVQQTRGYEGWNANYTPESLKELGRWLKANIKIEKLSEEEYKEKRATVPDYIQITDWTLTTATLSKLFDAGIYFGEVFIKSYPHLKWEQYFTKVKNHNDHGHMIIEGFGKVRLNPICIMPIIGLGLADDTDKEDVLYELFRRKEKQIT